MIVLPSVATNAINVAVKLNRVPHITAIVRPFVRCLIDVFAFQLKGSNSTSKQTAAHPRRSGADLSLGSVGMILFVSD